MDLVIDLRRKRVKIIFEATQEEMGRPDVPVNVEVKVNKRQNRAILTEVPTITAKLLHYLTGTSAVLSDSTYEITEMKIREAVGREKSSNA